MPIQTSAFDYDLPWDRHKQLVVTGEHLERAERHLMDASVVACDFETSGVAWMRHARSCGIALGRFDVDVAQDAPTTVYYLPYRHRTTLPQLDFEVAAPVIDRVLRRENKVILAHNAKFEIHFAALEGWHLGGELFDTQVGARLVDERSDARLKDRAVRDLGRKDAQVYETHLKAAVHRCAKNYACGVSAYKDRYGYSEAPLDLCAFYACHDAEFTLQLYGRYVLRDRLFDVMPRVIRTEMALVRELTRTEQFGMGIDADYLDGLATMLQGKLGELEKAVWQHYPKVTPFALTRDNELRRFLLDDLHLPLYKKTKSGDQLSVDRSVLEEFSDREPGLLRIANWRDAQKISTTYTQSILDRLGNDGRLHCSIRQMGTKTGRMSSTEPNLTNIVSDSDVRALQHSGKSLEDGGIDPWSVRRAFTVQPGWVRVFADWSQIELRVLASYTQDPLLMDSYIKGEDVHTRTSLEVFGSKDLRRRAKTINFGIVYGLQPQGLSKQLKVSVEEAEKYMRLYYARYHGIPAFRTQFWARTKRRGGNFANLWGRQHHWPELVTAASPFEIGKAQRGAFAALVQGTAAELSKEAVALLGPWLRAESMQATISNIIHDEIAVDCPQHEATRVVAMMRFVMQNFPEFAPIPILVDFKFAPRHWAETFKLPSKEAAA